MYTGISQKLQSDVQDPESYAHTKKSEVQNTDSNYATIRYGVNPVMRQGGENLPFHFLEVPPNPTVKNLHVRPRQVGTTVDSSVAAISHILTHLAHLYQPTWEKYKNELFSTFPFHDHLAPPQTKATPPSIPSWTPVLKFLAGPFGISLTTVYCKVDSDLT